MRSAAVAVATALAPLAALLMQPTANVISDEPVRIGAIQPLTKGTAAFGFQVKSGVDLAVEDVNSAGGINGRRLEVVYEDDECDRVKAVTAANKLVHVDKITVIIGPTCSSNVLAVAPVAEANKVIVLTTVASTPKITHAGDYIFRNTPSGDDYSEAIADFAYNNLSARTASSLYINLDNGVDFKDAFRRRFEELGGRVLSEEAYENEATDFRAQLLRIKAAAPDAIFLAGQVNPGLAIKQARELGLGQQIIGPTSMEAPDLIVQGGEAVDGVIYSAPLFDPGDPAIADFNGRYERVYGKPANFRAVISYDAIMITAGLLKKCNEDADCIKGGLYATQNYTGLSGVTSFDANGDVIKPLMIKTVRGGKFVPY